MDIEKLMKDATENGHVVFSHGNTEYMLVNLEVEPMIEMTEDEKIEFVARRILRDHHAAFEELAKL